MPTSEKPKGRTPATAGGIDSELNRLHQRVDELRRIQAMSRRINLILAIIVVAEFALFVYFTREHVQANFNPEDVQRAVAERVPKVTPQLREHFMAVAQHTLPIYREQVTQRFQKVGPEVARDALARLQKLPQENGDELNKHLRSAFDVALSRIEPDMKKAYPMLSQEQQASILQRSFQGVIDAENADIAHHVNDLAENELKTMHEVLDKFDVPSEASLMSHPAREREFLHALVDVMMDSEFTFKSPAAPGSPSTRPAMVSADAPAASVAASH